MKLLFSTMLVMVFFYSSTIQAEEPSSDLNIRSISVTGKARVKYQPDLVIIGIGVSMQNDNPVELQTAIRNATAEMMLFSKSMGIEINDISTENISLKERGWQFDEDDCPEIVKRPKFQAESSIEIVLRDFKLYDRLVDGLFKNGATRLDDVTFDSTRRIEKKKEARIQAVKAAREKATYLAKELGQKIGRPLKISEVSNNYILSSVNSVIIETVDLTQFSSSSLSQSHLMESASVAIIFALEDRL